MKRKEKNQIYLVRAQHSATTVLQGASEVRPKKKNIVNFPDSFQRDQYSLETRESDALGNSKVPRRRRPKPASDTQA